MVKFSRRVKSCGLTNPPQNRRSVHKKRGAFFNAPLKLNQSNYLLSPTVASVVPSALEGLTAVFGMGTGVSPPARSLRKFFKVSNTTILSKLDY